MGAGRLQAEGTSLIASPANIAATDSAKRAAMLQAVGAKASDGALPYGAPDGATGTAAYSLVLAAANGESESNATRGGAAIARLALASASGLFVRRRFAG